MADIMPSYSDDRTTEFPRNNGFIALRRQEIRDISMRRCGLAFFLLLLMIDPVLQAASPALSAIRPVGGQRGTQLDITLSGARLGDAQEIIYYQPGITTVGLKKLDDNSVRATIKIAADCAGFARRARKDGDGDQRAAHLQRGRSQGAKRGRT